MAKKFFWAVAILLLVYAYYDTFAHGSDVPAKSVAQPLADGRTVISEPAYLCHTIIVPGVSGELYIKSYVERHVDGEEDRPFNVYQQEFKTLKEFQKARRRATIECLNQQEKLERGEK